MCRPNCAALRYAVLVVSDRQSTQAIASVCRCLNEQPQPPPVPQECRTCREGPGYFRRNQSVSMMSGVLSKRSCVCLLSMYCPDHQFIDIQTHPNVALSTLRTSRPICLDQPPRWRLMSVIGCASEVNFSARAFLPLTHSGHRRLSNFAVHHELAFLEAELSNCSISENS